MKRKRGNEFGDAEGVRTKRHRGSDPWAPVFDGLEAAIAKEEDATLPEDDQSTFMSPAQAILAQVSAADPFVEIQRRIDVLHTTFRTGWAEGQAPYYYQEVMFDHMIVMSMRWIVGSEPEFERLKPQLMERLGLDRWLKSYDQVMPRQYGKTEGLSHGNKALTMHLPMRIAIFAQGARNSEQDLKLAKEDIKRALPPGEEWRFKVDKVDQFEFEVIALDPRHVGKRSVVTAYPSSGDSKF